MKSVERNMTEGRPAKLIVQFALPVLGGLLFQYLYGFVDTLIAGRFLGVAALSGIGAVIEISFLATGFCNGAGSGFSVPVAQNFGAGDDRGMRRSFANGIYLVAFFALILTVLSTTLCRDMIGMIKTPPESTEYAYQYQFIIFCGVPCLFFYNYLANVIRAIGNSRFPVRVLIAASILNVVLDYTLVVHAGMGVAGTAVATVFAQFFSAVVCLIYILKKLPRVRPQKEDWKPDFRVMTRSLRIGLPMGFQFSIMAIGNVILQTSVNALGKDFLASFTAANRLAFGLAGPFDAIGAAMVTFAGQNKGAGRWDRISKGVNSAFRILSVYTVFAVTLMYFAGRFVIRLFVGQAVSDEVVRYAWIYMLATGIFYLCRMVIDVLRNTLQGTGNAGITLLSGLGEMIARVIAGLWIIPVYGMIAVTLNHSFAWLLADLFILPAYLVLRKKELAAMK